MGCVGPGAARGRLPVQRGREELWGWAGGSAVWGGARGTASRLRPWGRGPPAGCPVSSPGWAAALTTLKHEPLQCGCQRIPELGGSWPRGPGAPGHPHPLPRIPSSPSVPRATRTRPRSWGPVLGHRGKPPPALLRQPCVRPAGQLPPHAHALPAALITTTPSPPACCPPAWAAHPAGGREGSNRASAKTGSYNRSANCDRDGGEAKAEQPSSRPHRLAGCSDRCRSQQSESN